MSRYHRAVVAVGSPEQQVEMLEGEVDYAENRVREARKMHNRAQEAYWEAKRRETVEALDEVRTPCLI